MLLFWIYFRFDLPSSSSDSNDSNDEYSELSAERLKLEMEIDAAFSSNISDFEPDGIVGGDMDTKSLDRSVASSPFLSSNSEKRKLLKKRAGTNYKIARLKLEETGPSIIDFTHLEGRGICLKVRLLHP